MSWNINGMWRPLQHNINSLKAALVYWLVDRIAVWEDPVPSVLWRCWLGGRKGIRPVKTEWWGAGMVIWLERGADLHMAQLMPLSLASVKSRLVFPFWYRLTWVVPDKGPLNGCVCERTQVRMSPWTVVFTVTATAICSLGHGLCCLVHTYCSVVHRSTQPWTPLVPLNQAPHTAGVTVWMSLMTGGM